MDYSDLLNIAKDNKDEAQRKSTVRYTTSVSAAKKMERSRVQSHAIRAFLKKKDDEERRKALEADRKKQELLALRSAAKHNRKATVMARRTKDNNFARSFDQPPEVKEEEKKEKPEVIRSEPRREPAKPEVAGNKRRVARDDERRKIVETRREPIKFNGKTARERNVVADPLERAVEKVHTKPKAPSKPVNFFDLLKLAKEKQFEPVEVVVRKETKYERPMTQEEKERTQEEENRRMIRNSGSYTIPKKASSAMSPVAGKAPTKPTSKPTKTTDVVSKSANKNVPTSKLAPAKSASRNDTKLDLHRSKVAETRRPPQKEVVPTKMTPVQKVLPKPSSTKEPSSSNREREIALATRKKMAATKTPARSVPPKTEHASRNVPQQRTNGFGPPKTENASRNVPQQRTNGFGPPKTENASRNVPQQRTNGFGPPRNVALEKRQSIGNVPDRRPAPKDAARRLPMRDVAPRRPMTKGVPRPMPRMQQRLPVKRRIESSDEDEEMDDFIDDGPTGEEELISEHIREIFGYDRRNYEYEREDDIDQMESSFVQQMKEEAYSARMGLKEDLDDIRMEEEQLRKKNCKSNKKKRCR